MVLKGIALSSSVIFSLYQKVYKKANPRIELLYILPSKSMMDACLSVQDHYQSVPPCNEWSWACGPQTQGSLSRGACTMEFSLHKGVSGTRSLVPGTITLRPFFLRVSDHWLVLKIVSIWMMPVLAVLGFSCWILEHFDLTFLIWYFNV